MADDRNRPGNSFFTNAAIASPVLIGVGVGARNLLRTMNSSQLRLHTNSGRAFLRNFAAQNLSGRGVNMFSGDLSIMNNANPDMIHMAWEMALGQADPSKIVRRTPLDAVNPAGTIEQFARTEQSLQAGKVLQSFVRQLGGMYLHENEYAGPLSMSMFGKAKKHTFMRSNVSLTSIQNSQLQITLSAIQSKVKELPGVEMNLQRTSRTGLSGSQLMLHLSGGKFGNGIAVELPEDIGGTESGVIAHGITQQTKRMVGMYDVVENGKIVSTLKHEEFVARRFLDHILSHKLSDSSLSPSAVRKIVSDFNYENIEGSQWMANIPKGLIPAHDAALSLGGNRHVLIDKYYNRLNAQQAAEVLEKNPNRFASTSGAQLAKGVVSGIDAQKFWFGGEAFPWARRPMQALGRGFGPSDKAVMARLGSKVRTQFDWLHTKDYNRVFGTERPMDIMARTVYVSEKKYAKFAEEALGGTLGGTGLYSAVINNQMEHVMPLSENITVNAPVLKRLIEGMGEDSHFSFDDKQMRFHEGEILGFDKNRNPVHYTPDMNIKGGFIYSDRDVQFIHLHGTKTLPTEISPKVFGSAKAVLQQTQPAVFEKMLQEGTGQRLTGFEIALGMDELKKNKALHNTQMLTALHDFTFKHMRSRNGGALSLENFNATFSKSAQEMVARAAHGSVYKQEEVLKGVHKMIREVNLGEHAIGRIFGALPDVYKVPKDANGKDLYGGWREALDKMHGITFTDPEVAEIEKGVVEGVGSYFYGGPANSGGMGSVEPRFFELLQGKQFGALGPRMSKDIAQRMIMANPEIVREQSILTRALHSMAVPVKLAKDDKSYSLRDMTHYDMNKLLEEGGVVNTDGMVDDVKHFVVPGTKDSMLMREYVTPEGLSTHSLLHYAYRNFLEIGQQATRKEASRSSASAAFGDLIAELGAARESTITGKHTGLARGKVLGSRYLKVISATEKEMGDMYTVGVSKEHGENMFNELERLYRPTIVGGQAIHDGNPEELAALMKQKEAFLKGESVGAIVRRDPEIGPYSAMPMKFKMSKRLKGTSDILIPQKTVNVTDINGNAIGDPISFGAMPGFAGDFDGDNVHIMLTSSKIEKDVAGHFGVGSHSTKQYEDYILRQQIIKAKAPPATDITRVAEMTADAQKLAIAKSHVGPLSVPMRELRAALSEYEGKHEGHKFFNALSVLEALEQTPIAGKHVPADRIDEFTQQMTQIAAAGKAGRGRELTGILGDVLKHNKEAQSVFSGDQQVFVDGTQRTIKGIDLNEVADTFKQAYSHYRSSTGAMSEGVSRAIANGSMRMTKQNIVSQIANGGGLLADFKLGFDGGPMGEVVRTAIAVKNKVAAVTGDVLQHMGKPLAIGFGAALGIAAILSKPISTIDPGRSAPTPRVNSQNTQSISPENLNPDSQVTGEPSIPNTMSGPSARYSNGQAAHVNIRGINASGANLSSVSSLITQRLRGNTNVNVNMRDRKTSLTQQKIDSIMRR